MPQLYRLKVTRIITDYNTHDTTFISAALYVQEASLLLYAIAATD